MIRTRMAGLALLLAALLVAGCGGGGGGEPTVTQTLHDELQAELQAELDAALAELAKEREAKAKEKTARDVAETEVARLRSNLATANTQAVTLENSLATANAEVTRLEGAIGAETDAADADGSLHAQLNAATAEATRLEGMIGDADDVAAADGSLHAQLNAAKAEVTELTNKIGSAADAESLEGMLAAAKTRVTELATLIGDPITPAAESLRGKLATATAKVTELAARIGSATNATSLQGKLTTAEAEVRRLTTALETEKAEVARLTTALATAQTAVTTERQRATEADQRATEIERQGDVNARWRGVLKHLKTFDGTAWGTSENPATVRINERKTNIEIAASPLKGSTRTSGNFYTATLMRTAPGVNQPERKTAVYSDREKSRSFANHYAGSIIASSTVGGTQANPRFQNSIWAPSVGGLDLLTDASKMLVSNPSRGSHPATIPATIPNPEYDSNDPDDSQRRIANPNTDPADKMVNTLSATVHGVSGHYGCYNSATSKACKVTVDAEYAQEIGNHGGESGIEQPLHHT